MAAIEISAAFAAAMPARLYRLSEYGYNTAGGARTLSRAGLLACYNGATGDQYTAWTRIFLMKGTPLTTRGTLISARAADILCEFRGAVAFATGVGAPAIANPMSFNTIYQAASASGTATWFWWCVQNTGPGVSDSASIFHEIFGTVGVTGSGADLELPDTNIVAGQNYRISNLRVSFPTSWTY